MNKNILIIGGGIIGLSSAYYLSKEGHQVTVVDQSDLSNGASYVNAGIITPSHIISLASPGMISKGMKWMLNSYSPFTISPQLTTDFIRWTWLFKKAANKTNVEKSIPIIKNINLFSKDLFEEIKKSDDFNFYYKAKGLLMYYKTDRAGEEEWNVGQKAIQEGLKVALLTAKEVTALEPHVKTNIQGAVYYHSDAHTTPCQFMEQLKTFLKNKGVQIIPNTKVTDITITNNKATSIETTEKTYSFDELIIASGAWTPILCKKLALKVPIQAGKGYRINVPKTTGISIPSILTEAKVAVTPMNGFTRFAGTMEIGGLHHKINTKRVHAIAKAAERYYTSINISQKDINNASCGLRPCSPDGLPYIGKLSKIKNITLATGHAMMGWSLGPATGKLVSELISEKKTSIDMAPFHVERYNY